MGLPLTPPMNEPREGRDWASRPGQRSDPIADVMSAQRLSTMLKCSLWLTALFGTAPLLLYAWARLTGSLPSPDNWDRHFANHGPWWDSLQGVIIYGSDLPLMLLGGLSLLSSIVLGVTRRKGRLVIAGMAMVALQAAVLIIHFWYLFWTVD